MTCSAPLGYCTLSKSRRYASLYSIPYAQAGSCFRNASVALCRLLFGVSRGLRPVLCCCRSVATLVWGLARASSSPVLLSLCGDFCLGSRAGFVQSFACRLAQPIEAFVCVGHLRWFIGATVALVCSSSPNWDGQLWSATEFFLWLPSGQVCRSWTWHVAARLLVAGHAFCLLITLQPGARGAQLPSVNMTEVLTSFRTRGAHPGVGGHVMVIRPTCRGAQLPMCSLNGVLSH